MNNFFKNKNPFWRHAECQLFVVRRNNKTVGRIAAIIDHAYCDAVKKNIGYFGFFECINDPACATALLQTAQEWLLSKDMKIMRGPVDGRIDMGCGFLFEGFDSRPSLLSTYSPKYYLTFAEDFGLKKARDFFQYSIDLTHPLPKGLEKKAKQCIESGIRVRPFQRLLTKKELKWWIPLFLETFSDHWGYVPVPQKEVQTRFGVKQLAWFVDTRLFLVAEQDTTPVAYLWATPDYNQIFQKMKGRLGPLELLRFLCTQRKIKTGKLHFIGITKELRKQNIGSLLNYEALQEMKKRGYNAAEVGWIDEQNTTAHITIALTGAILNKKHRVFEKNINT
ncbi:MAG: GNAT family N-acetyltransferase [Candidatus Thermoplasmatota archaeon]|nr:GNAT family N-acetyltransferase [Candidatus Thermoplasmatota archaeon]